MKKLSKQEQIVLMSLKMGHKNKMIAKMLFINEKTVSTYVNRIRQKLELKPAANTYKLVNTAIQNDLI
jgi:DNA-binding NarL/FixJ family response regulator